MGQVAQFPGIEKAAVAVAAGFKGDVGLAGIGVSMAQDDAPTPTPTITTTESPETSDSAESAESAATPTPTPIVTTTESTDSHTTITVFGLTLAQWLQLAISAAVVLLVAQYGGALLVRLARRLTRRTKTELDDEILSVIRPQVSWFIAAVGFQIATARLAFTSESVDALLGDVYFVLYWFVIVATVWRIRPGGAERHPLGPGPTQGRESGTGSATGDA